MAKREIRKLTRSTNLLFPKRPFRRLVREITQDFKSDMRFTDASLQAIQEAAEIFLTETFHKADMARKHAKRLTVDINDIRFTRFMTPDSLWVMPDKIWDKETFAQSREVASFAKGPNGKKNQAQAASSADSAEKKAGPLSSQGGKKKRKASSPAATSNTAQADGRGEKKARKAKPTADAASSSGEQRGDNVEGSRKDGNEKGDGEQQKQKDKAGDEADNNEERREEASESSESDNDGSNDSDDGKRGVSEDA